jgi:GWxTD domain-containing protein
MSSRLGKFSFLLVVLAALPCHGQNISKQELQRRIAFADAHFTIPPTSGRAASPGTPGSTTDRGKVYIALGPPDQIRDVEFPPNTTAVTLPTQAWTYQAVPGVGNNVRIEFVDFTFSYDYKMVPPPRDDIEALRRYELVQKRIQRTLARIIGIRKEGN